jgi:NAD(P)-dependent dehydrogenase (short-subunit alcohol dehydrogenase family)
VTKAALVTGAAQGVGLATATLLAERGYAVLLTDVQPLDATVARMRSAGHAVDGLSGDVSSESFAQELAAHVAAVHGALDVMDVNLLGPFLLCKHLGAQMLARGRGSIVNIASIAGLRGVSHRAAYNASKHGLIGLTHTLAAEWGGRGVRVNAICPGWIKTEMDEADQGPGNYSDDDIKNRVPMARFASPRDVSEAVAFLADAGLSGFVNGVSLPVDGGWLADASWETLRLRTRIT